jgi:hypothetical protein
MIVNAMEFFQHCAGRWRSQRTTHHLPFRRAETGDSEIFVEALAADHPKVIEICKLHEVDPSLAIGGAFVSWDGSMAWDKIDENHQGNTIFTLIPDADSPRRGMLLRERGYAEIVPIAGRYQMDDEDGLVLITEYETMSSIERFWFVSPNLRLRTSTVQRFGGFNTATFCAEIRAESESSEANESEEHSSEETPFYSISGW